MNSRKSRHQLTKKHVTWAMDRIEKQLAGKISKRGMGRYESVHEIYGIVAEEAYELLKATHENHHSNFEDELIDVCVGCIWGLASMKHLREEGIY